MYKAFVFCCVLVSSLVVVSPNKVSAAACAPPTTFGSIQSSVHIPTAGEYVLWVRLNPPASAGNIVDIEVGGNTCFTLNNAGLPTSSLSWVNYSGTSTSAVMKYTFNSTGPVTIKVTGLADDVKVDRVMLIGVGENCSSNGTSPKDLGTNCETGVVAGSSAGGSTSPPSTTTPPIVTAEPENVEQVEYYVNGELIQTVDSASGFDTSLIPNGEYELTTKVTKKDGSVVEQKETIIVSNPPQRFGTLRRWIRQNQTSVFIAGGLLGTLAIGGVVYFGIRSRHHHKMFLMHHGLGA